MKFSSKRWGFLLILFIIVSAALILTPSSEPSMASSMPVDSPPSGIDAGNYCVSCHLAEDSRLAGASGWTGGIERAQSSPCPAVLRIQEELFYTEQVMLATDRLRAELPGWAVSDRLDDEILNRKQGYHRLLDMPVTSLSAFVSEAQMLRFRMGKNYTALSTVLENQKKLRILIVGALVTAVILLSLLWGLYNAQTAIRATGAPPSRWARKKIALQVFWILVVFGFFALPIFRVFTAEVATATESQQAVQTALDTAGRLADSADRAMGRAWMLARVGAAWNALDASQAEAILGEALQAAEESRLDTHALWGEAQAVWELSTGTGINEEKASLVSARLQAGRSRAWGMRLIASEWSEAAPDHAKRILEDAWQATGDQDGIYRDLDARLIAVSWASLEPDRAAALVRTVGDPALRAWGLREIAALTGRIELYQEAAQSARLVSEPLARARQLWETGTAAGDASLFQEAQAALESLPDGPALAFAQAELAAASGSVEVVQSISQNFPEARSFGYFLLGDYLNAWNETQPVSNPYARGRAQAVIVSAWKNLEAAGKIQPVFFQDLALRDIALATGDRALVDRITSPYDRVQALTGLGDLPAAWEAASDLTDFYPLVELASAWASISPEESLQVVEAMDREVDKADALRAIAAAGLQEDVFQRALGMALAARQRGDALRPVQTSLALAQVFLSQNDTWARTALAQALETAQRISVK